MQREEILIRGVSLPHSHSEFLRHDKFGTLKSLRLTLFPDWDRKIQCQSMHISVKVSQLHQIGRWKPDAIFEKYSLSG